jgi:hypothetical protein
MMFSTLRRFLASGSRDNRDRRALLPARPRQHQASLLRLETLEHRLLLTVFSVSNLNDSGAGSLRDAIIQANASQGADTIAFTVTGTINVQTGLPDLNDTSGGTTIDGRTAPGYAGAPVVALRGPSEFCGFAGLKITSANNSVQALQIQKFVWGIHISGSAASGNTVAGCYIGHDGDDAFLNWVGITIHSATNNLIGTDGDGVNDADERNVISGNATQGIQIDSEGSPDEPATGNVVAGNYIGTNAAGTGALSNNFGIWLQGSAANTRIGTDGNGNGHDLSERNIISGNARGGVRLESDNNVVAGNYIGTDVTGQNALPNGENTTHYGAVYVVGNNNLVGTDSDGVADEAERNVISGNKSLSDRDAGIRVAGDGTIVAGNFIGTDATGTMALPNVTGVADSGTNTRIGTDGDGIRDDVERNVISGNEGHGVSASGSNLVIAGNCIGTDVSGEVALQNTGRGVLLGGCSGTRISTEGTNPASRNIIAFNGLAGVSIEGGAIGNSVRGNSIYGNGGLGINLDVFGVTANDLGDGDTGPNNLQNFPVITAAASDGTNTTINGTINSTANTTFTIDAYSSTTGDPSGYGEGETYLGTTTALTDASGDGTWSLTVAEDVTGLVLSATATDSSGNTSEFSAALSLNIAPVAVDDTYEMYGTGLTIPAAGVLTNDSDPDSDPFEAVLVDPPAHGALTLNDDGSFTYTPGPGFGGIDSFTYQADDGTALSNLATVTITHMLYVRNFDDSGEGSLRWTMDNANGHPGADTIQFAVAGTINVVTQLPNLSDSTGGTTIDGATAPGYAGSPAVVLDGPGISSFLTGLQVTSANNQIAGLQIQEFLYGIRILGSSAFNNLLTGNYIGTDGHIP